MTQEHMEKNQRKKSGLMAIFWVIFAVIFVVAAGLSSAEAAAGGGKIYFVQKRVPDSFSAKKMLSYVRKHKALRLKESSEKKLENRKWKADMVIVLKRPLGDSEYKLEFFPAGRASNVDLSHLTQTYFHMNQDEKIIIQSVKLARSDYPANQPLRAAVSVRGRIVAETKLELVGQRIKRSGKIDFTVDETK